MPISIGPPVPLKPSSRSIVFYDALRNFFVGSLLPLTEVILMIYFIQVLDGSTGEKTFLAIAIKSGYLFSIPISLFLMRQGLAVRSSLTLIFSTSMLALVAIIFASQIWMVILLAAVIGFSLHGSHTIASEIYTSYKKENRGRLSAFSNIALFLGSIFFTLLFRRIIGEDENLQFASVAVLCFVALLLAILSSRQIKLPPLVQNTNTDNKAQKKELTLKKVLEVLRVDKMFTYVITAWMMLGLGNLWLLPYRTNLLVEEAFGFQYDEKTVLLLLVIIPEIIYVVFSIPFGIFFDKFNFILLRIIINTTFIAYFVFFFFGTSFLYHAIGMVCFGLARAGGTLAWKMWINKMVDNERVPVYMTVHMAATGLRMVLTPLFGLIGLYTLGPTVCGIISIGFMSVSIVMFIPLLRYGKTRFSH